jgi:putative ABC transport system permease protein
MSWRDLISMAVRNLLKRKMRTFLTVLGVIIGTASIVVMISVGIGMNESFKSQIEQMGSLSIISVYNYGGGATTNQKKVILDKATIDKFKQIEGVEAASPVKSSYYAIIDGKYVCTTSVKGIDPAVMELMGYKIAEGRSLQEGDSMAIVLGAYCKDEFYNPKQSRMNWYNGDGGAEVDVFNDKMKITYDTNYGAKGYDKSIKPEKIQVVGVLDQASTDSWSSFMPLKDLEKIEEARNKKNNTKDTTKKNGYEEAVVKVKNINDVDAIQEEIKNMGFQTSSLKEYLNSMQQSSRMLQLVLGAIGAVSLFVAAIGITNTMVMSIYERTKEIGVMKVIGASVRDIRMLFLTEASFIGFMGGLVGIILSFIVSKAINVVAMNLGQQYNLSHIPFYLAIAAVVFATFVGTAAGFMPAVRATKLSALTAIKTE